MQASTNVCKTNAFKYVQDENTDTWLFKTSFESATMQKTEGQNIPALPANW